MASLSGRVDRVIAWDNAPDRRVDMVVAIGWVAALLHQAHACQRTWPCIASVVPRAT